MPESKPLPKNAASFYFRIGIIGSLPNGFFEAFAEKFGARFISAGQISAAVEERRQREGFTKPAPAQPLINHLNYEVQPLLMDHHDVVTDMHFNNRKKRLQTPIRLGQATGALTIALNVITPIDNVKARVNRWIKTGTLKKPLEEWRYHPLVKVKNMNEQLERPDEEAEGLDAVIDIDGSGDDLSAIFDQVESGLDSHGLLKED